MQLIIKISKAAVIRKGREHALIEGKLFESPELIMTSPLEE
jgi:hypothetical protein